MTVCAGVVGLHGAATERPVEAKPRAANAPLVLAALLLASCYGVQLSILVHAARTQVPFPAWFSGLPLLTIEDRAPRYGHAPVGAAIAACTLIETAALVWLYLAARNKALGPIVRIVLAAAFFAMAGGSFATPVTTSYDMYAYAGAARVPNAYRPPGRTFDGSFSVINRIYGTPIPPTPYGPAWVVLSRLLLGPISSLGGQLLALRAAGLLALVACALALHRLHVDAATIALAALNPALIASFVLDGHNDLVPLALVLWGSVLVKRNNVPLAMTFGILAANMKLSFLAIAPLALARIEPRRVRLADAATLLGGAVALALVAGGNDYVRALRMTSRAYGAFSDPATTAAHLLLGLSALACIAAALWAGRYVPSGAWAFCGLGATFFGWYVPWGLPYAVLERTWLPAFLISLPSLGLFLATWYAPGAATEWSLKLAIVVAPVITYVALRRRGPSPPSAGDAGRR